MDKLLSVTEAASELGITRQAVCQKIDAGEIEATMVGNQWVIHRDALAAYYENKAAKLQADADALLALASAVMNA